MNCPLCRSPIRSVSTSGRTVTCFEGHETHFKSQLPGVLPTIPGWLCWQTRSNSGISEMRYAYWGDALADREDTDSFGQELIDRYEDWINHASHSAGIDWDRNCAVPAAIIAEHARRLFRKAEKALDQRTELLRQLAIYYPETKSS